MGKAGVSIIIPIYNAERFIAECLESVSQSAVFPVEIICIDDGSTDSSLGIIERFVELNDNIHLYKQDHHGAGAARNFGLQVASEEYVAFLDSDDKYASLSVLEKMLSICESKNINVCGCTSWMLDINGRYVSEKIIDSSEDVPIGGRIIQFSEWQNDYGYTNFIYKKKFLLTNDIQFPTYQRYEDPVFFLKVLDKAKDIYIIPEILYICKVGYKGSVVLDNAIKDILCGVRDNMSLAKQKGYARLRERLLERLENDFYYPIKQNLDDETMRILLEISGINEGFERDIPIRILKEIYVQNEDGKGYRTKADNIVIRDNELFDNAQQCMNMEGGFAGFLEGHGIASVCIYGAGLYGRLLCQNLQLHDIEVVGYIDMDQSKNTEGIPLYTPKSKFPHADLLVVTIRDSDKVVELYRNLGIAVISLAALMDCMLGHEKLSQYVIGDD